MPNLHTLTQYLLPKQALTRLAGAGARLEGGALTQWAIRRFIQQYQVNMQEAAEPDPSAYTSFNAIFTRALRPGARPLADSDLICPVDGAVSQLGNIDAGRIFQAKGHDYTATALLAGDGKLAEHFVDGQFATIYLSPRDYHRYHAPCDMRILSALYVPGELYSVAVSALLKVPNLYAKNERVVLKCELASGKKMWLVFVGALNVGKMKFDFDARIQTNACAGNVALYEYENLSAKKGEQLGMFELGSTILILSEQGAVKFDLAAEQKLKYGDKIGTIN